MPDLLAGVLIGMGIPLGILAGALIVAILYSVTDYIRSEPRRASIGALAVVIVAAVAVGCPSLAAENPLAPLLAADDHPVEYPVVCWMKFHSDRREADSNGWATDHPRAGWALSLRLAEMTTARVPLISLVPPRPDVPVVDIDRPGVDERVDTERRLRGWRPAQGMAAIHRCPVLISSDLGTVALSGIGRLRLRDYLRRGGFLWATDFWGEASWTQFSAALADVLPEGRAEQLEPTHALHAPIQVSHIGYWRSYGETAERGIPATTWVYRDAAERVVVLITRDNDILDVAEHDAATPSRVERLYAETFRSDAYAYAIRVVLWAMAH